MTMVNEMKNTHWLPSRVLVLIFPELEAMAINMGAKVMTTIKYHAEYTGEGIEYAWGVMKSTYQKIKLEDKKRKGKFY